MDSYHDCDTSDPYRMACPPIPPSWWERYDDVVRIVVANVVFHSSVVVALLCCDSCNRSELLELDMRSQQAADVTVRASQPCTCSGGSRSAGP